MPLRSAPTIEGAKRAIRGICNRKAPRHDYLHEKLLEVNGRAEPTVLKRFHTFLVKAWNGDEVPQTWKDETTVRVPYEKSDQSNCNDITPTVGESHSPRTQKRCSGC